MFCKNLVLDYSWPTAVPEITYVSATHTASAAGALWECGKDCEETGDHSLFLGALHAGCRDSAGSQKDLMKFTEQGLGKRQKPTK